MAKNFKKRLLFFQCYVFHFFHFGSFMSIESCEEVVLKECDRHQLEESCLKVLENFLEIILVGDISVKMIDNFIVPLECFLSEFKEHLYTNASDQGTAFGLLKCWPELARVHLKVINNVAATTTQMFKGSFKT